MIDLKDKRSIVTGAASGIGRGIACCLAEAGAKVAVAHIGTAEAARETAALFPKDAESMVVEADIRNQQAVQAMVEQVALQWGGLDVMVCNAGIYFNGPFLDFPIEKLQALIQTNLMGTWICAQAAARWMVDGGKGGRIVVTASTQGYRPVKDTAAYAMIKSALIGFVRAMAYELADFGITVNSISPGVTLAAGNTAFLAVPEQRAFVESQIPLKRIGIPLDMGNAVAFLASDLASYITGTDLVIDGGLLLAGPSV